MPICSASWRGYWCRRRHAGPMQPEPPVSGSEAGVSLHCPVPMTGAVAYVLDRHGAAAIKEKYLASLTRMDGAALSGGTWATELHGGSDIGGTTTSARRVGDHFLLNGLKWFASNPDGGLALATA